MQDHGGQAQLCCPQSMHVKHYKAGRTQRNSAMAAKKYVLHKTFVHGVYTLLKATSSREPLKLICYKKQFW